MLRLRLVHTSFWDHFWRLQPIGYTCVQTPWKKKEKSLGPPMSLIM